jgi:hypothetical protein
VVRGTAATRPIDPTSVRTISTDTTSELVTKPSGRPERLKRMSNGIAAPAYARSKVFTVDEM